MGNIINLWIVAQLIWACCVKLKPLHLIAFLLMHGLLFWVLFTHLADLKLIFFHTLNRQNLPAVFFLLWSMGLISFVGRICDKVLKEGKAPARITKRDIERENFHQKPRS